MPRLKMPSGQQVIYEELIESAGGARMLTLRQVAQFFGKDDRSARKFAKEKALPRYDLNGLHVYAARDVAKAIYDSEV
jgi:hypothetical protein